MHEDLDDFIADFLDLERRIIRAEADMLEALAWLAPRMAHDRRWLKAAAAKECCAAELVRALAAKEKQLRKARQGPDGNGGGVPAFGDELFDALFAPLIEKYLGKKEMLAEWRQMFGELADQLADFVKNELSETYAEQVYPDVLPDGGNVPEVASLPHACDVDRDAFRDAFRHPQGGDAAGPDVFDPWTGRWTGKWTWREDTVSRPNHVWDETREVDGRHVQPVTQSNQGLIDSENAEVEWEARRTDLAINIYDDECGIGGWVAKREGIADGRTQHLPSIGYRPLPNVLVWISQAHDEDCNLFDPRDDSFFIFFEWVDERGLYGILGKRFRVIRRGNRRRIRGLTRRERYEGEQHGGLYEEQPAGGNGNGNSDGNGSGSGQ